MGDVPAENCKAPDGLSQSGSVGHTSVRSFGTRHARSLSHALLVVYILAKIFGDIGDVSVSFIAPTHGTKLGLSVVTVGLAFYPFVHHSYFGSFLSHHSVDSPSWIM